MKTSDSIVKISEALVKAHWKLGGVAKTANNPFFKSKYADLASVVEAVKAPLLEQGIIFTQGVHDAEGGVAIETMLLHSSGEWISSTLRIPATKEDAQGYGSAITYGRRYGLQAICGVPSEDDDGNAATATAPAPSRNTPVAGSLAALSKEDQEKAKRTANSMVDFWNAGEEFKAYEAYYDAGHPNEMLLGIWEVLQPHSVIRNKLKKMHNQPKAA